MRRDLRWTVLLYGAPLALALYPLWATGEPRRGMEDGWLWTALGLPPGMRHGWLWDPPSQVAAWGWTSVEIGFLAALWGVALWLVQARFPSSAPGAKRWILRLPWLLAAGVLTFPPWIVRHGQSPGLTRHGPLWGPPEMADGIAWGPLSLELGLLGILWMGLKQWKPPPSDAG